MVLPSSAASRRSNWTLLQWKCGVLWPCRTEATGCELEEQDVLTVGGRRMNAEDGFKNQDHQPTAHTPQTQSNRVLVGEASYKLICSTESYPRDHAQNGNQNQEHPAQTLVFAIYLVMIYVPILSGSFEAAFEQCFSICDSNGISPRHD